MAASEGAGVERSGDVRRCGGGRRERSRRATLAAVALAAGPALAACSGFGDGAPEGAPATPPSLELGFAQYRGDEVRRAFKIAVTNASGEPLVVDSVRLDAAGFEPGPAAEPRTRLAPGERTSFRVTYTRAVCDLPAGAPTPGAVVSTSAPDGRRLGEQRVAFTRGREQFDQVYAGECASLALRRSVELSWDPTWSPGTRQGSLRGTLRVRRLVPGPAVTVDQLAGTVIFTLWTVPEGLRPAATLAAGQDEVGVPVEVVPTRCDPHARAESKKTFLFPVWVALGDGPPAYTTLSPPAAGVVRLQALIDDVCGSQGLPNG
jgi:hypothetical protein